MEKIGFPKVIPILSGRSGLLTQSICGQFTFFYSTLTPIPDLLSGKLTIVFKSYMWRPVTSRGDHFDLCLSLAVSSPALFDSVLDDFNCFPKANAPSKIKTLLEDRN